jgi:predicted nucleotidyltransferase
MFGLSEQTIDALNQVFTQYAGIEQVVVYGSRAKGNYRNGSDIDLTIVGDIEYADLMKLENELDDLLLPYKIDLSIKSKINHPDLIDHIDRVGQTFYDRATQAVLNEPQVKYKKAEDK